MSRVEKGRRVQITYNEKGPTGRPTLTVDVSADDDVLPHEHREDMRNMAAAVLGVPLASLEGEAQPIDGSRLEFAEPVGHAEIADLEKRAAHLLLLRRGLATSSSAAEMRNRATKRITRMMIGGPHHHHMPRLKAE